MQRTAAGVGDDRVRDVVPGLPPTRRTLVMAVVNVTPDSFSDGGRWLDPSLAIRHGQELAVEGADLIDVGGESTRPGAERPTAVEELRRVLPVVTALAEHGLAVSVDTMRAEVAAACIGAGARMINDVSGGLADPDMIPVVAEAGVGYVVMHWRGPARDMQRRAHYADVVGEVAGALEERAAAAEAGGVAAGRIVCDPGIGFGKTAQHNWELLRHLDRLAAAGRPLLVGVSRKAFLGALLAGPDGTPRSPAGRDDATVALTTLLARAGVWAVRTHTARPHRDAVDVVAAVNG